MKWRRRREKAAADLRAAHTLDQERRGLRQSSIKTRDGILRRFAEWLAPKPILEASREDVQAWLDSLKVGGTARRAYTSHLHAFYTWAQDEGLVSQVATARIRRPKERIGLPRPIPDVDLARALSAARAGNSPSHRRMVCFLLLGAYQGLRCIEIAGLHVEDVPDDAGGPLRIRDAKGGGERHPVPMHPDVLAALRTLPMPRSGPVFCRPGDLHYPAGQLRAHNVSHLTNDFLSGLGISATAHQLRHFFGTRIYQSTRDIRLTQELLGHAKVSTTALYAACDQTKAAPAVAALSIGSQRGALGGRMVTPDRQMPPATAQTAPGAWTTPD
ncbi:MAG TPA: tyrosine-type recombinase/integrase [Acidimicrobiales bacterium]